MDNSALPSPIAIDGPAASGKSSVGRALAADPGYRFLDTGLMYRAFTLAALRANVSAEDHDACAHLARTVDMRVEMDGEARILLQGEDVLPLLTESDVEGAVSHYSKIPGVRDAMVAHQRVIASDGPVVLAGRDIGTVVLPDAPLKFYLDAGEEARRTRRGLEAKDHDATRANNVAQRDQLDSTRTVSPLMPAEDAIRIDTTTLDLETVIALVRENILCAND